MIIVALDINYLINQRGLSLVYANTQEHNTSSHVYRSEQIQRSES